MERLTGKSRRPAGLFAAFGVYTIENIKNFAALFIDITHRMYYIIRYNAIVRRSMPFLGNKSLIM